MAHVLIKWSVPVQSGKRLLDGTLDTTIYGYQNFAVSIRTNLPRRDATQGVYAPTDYFITSQPSVTHDPPKTGLCSVVTVSTCYSSQAKNAVLTRLSGSQAGIT